MRLIATRRAAAVLVAGALAAGGCGGDGSGPNVGPASGGDSMPAVDVERVVRAQRRISSCRDDRGRRAVRQAAATLIAVYREGPDWIYQWGGSTEMGRPMRDVLADVRPRVAACGDPIALARIDDALAERRGG